jgi:MFS family permease
VAVVVTKNAGKRFNPLSLDAVNFLLADVRGALGPYLNVFLVTQQHWSQSEVGLVTTVGGLLGLAIQTPIGGAIDETRAKRGAIVLALAVLAVGAAIIFAWPTFWPVAFANSLMAIVGDVFGPAVAALTLGLYARRQLARRLGRNSAFDHAGNVAIAVAAAAIGYVFSQRAVFLLVPVFAVLAGIAVLSIPAEAIDFDRARNLERGPDTAGATVGAAGYGILFKSQPLLIFGLCVMLFHLANAALLPLVGQKLAAAYPKEATDDVGLHRRRPGGDAADRPAGRAHRRPLGTQAPVSRRVRRPADPRGALYALRRQRLADRGPGARWRGRRDLRRTHAARHRRHHARHRAL